jgi:hypothetical protein
MKIDMFRQILDLFFVLILNVSKKKRLNFFVCVEGILNLVSEVHEAEPQEATIAEKWARLAPWVELLETVMAI